MPGLLIGIDVGGTNFRLGVVQGLQVVWKNGFKPISPDCAASCRRRKRWIPSCRY